MTMSIGVWANDGSPIGVTYEDIYSNNRRIGVGGAELAMFTVLEGLANRGYDVTLFNDPKYPTNWNVRQANRSEIARNKEFDIFIVFRSPSQVVKSIKAKKKIWWSCDQATVGDFKSFFKMVDEAVLISPAHESSWWHRYRIQATKTTGLRVIDLPVRLEDYTLDNNTRIPNRFTFTSVPDRGLLLLLYMWKHIKKELPDATLDITSDYRLWGQTHAEIDYYKTMLGGNEGINYLGAIPRRELVKIQMQADMLLYPCIYEELFCIACAEAQVAGAFPITSSTGALETTNTTSGNLGKVHANLFKTMFIDKVLEMAEDRKQLEKERVAMLANAWNRFSIDTVLDQWESIWLD